MITLQPNTEKCYILLNGDVVGSIEVDQTHNVVAMFNHNACAKVSLQFTPVNVQPKTYRLIETPPPPKIHHENDAEFKKIRNSFLDGF